MWKWNFVFFLYWLFAGPDDWKDRFIAFGNGLNSIFSYLLPIFFAGMGIAIIVNTVISNDSGNIFINLFIALFFLSGSTLLLIFRKLLWR